MSWLENLFFFVTFGIIGVAMEVFFTAITSVIRKEKNRAMKGYSSLWMFFIYGSVYFVILFGRTYFSQYNFFLRGLIYLPLIYAIEFTSGFILKKFKAIPWNYREDKNTKHNFKGIICLEFIPVWYTGGLLLELLYLFLKSHLVF